MCPFFLNHFSGLSLLLNGTITVFRSWKRAITPVMIGGFYLKLNLTYILWLYTCVNKSTTSIIPRHSNYLFMYLSYRFENVWKENDGGTDNNPKPDLDNINWQMTILNQILIISMHIASLVKRPCYLLKLSSGNKNMGVSRADNSVKIWPNLPISNSKRDLLNVNAYSKFG